MSGTEEEAQKPELQMEFSKARMAALRVLYFIIIVLLLILAKAKWELSDSIFAAAVLAGLIAVIISYPLQLRMIYSVAYKKREVGDEAMIGLRGTAMERLMPEGKVKVRGEIWNAVSTSGPIEKGQEVLVEAVEGLKLKVRGAGENDLNASPKRSGTQK